MGWDRHVEKSAEAATLLHQNVGCYTHREKASVIICRFGPTRENVSCCWAEADYRVIDGRRIILFGWLCRLGFGNSAG